MAGFQSLSRDSWWSHHGSGLSLTISVAGFNPSVGILGGHTRSSPAWPTIMGWFQSLSRDSWWSHFRPPPGGAIGSWSFNPSVGILGGHTCDRAAVVDLTPVVSIPQSGFLVVTLESGLNTCNFLRVSIPQSGFLVVTPLGSASIVFLSGSFNPSVGILGGHTRLGRGVPFYERLFQSLSRDSWWSHFHRQRGIPGRR